MMHKIKKPAEKRRNESKLSEEIVSAIYRNELEALGELVNPLNINAVDREKRSVLFYAVLAKSIDMVKLLLKSQPDLNMKDCNGWSALHFAAQGNMTEIAKLLIENGADLEVKDDYGNTPLSRATFSSCGYGDLIKLLLSSGADPNHENNSGISPLKLANTIANYNVKQFF